MAMFQSTIFALLSHKDQAWEKSPGAGEGFSLICLLIPLEF